MLRSDQLLGREAGNVVVDSQGVFADAVRATALRSTSRVEDGGDVDRVEFTPQRSRDLISGREKYRRDREIGCQATATTKTQSDSSNCHGHLCTSQH
jgi:hypothetical protein